MYREENLKLALQNGIIELVKYLRIRGVRFGPSSLADATISGDMRFLKLIEEMGATISPEVCATSAKFGNFACLKYAYVATTPLPVVT